MNEKQMIMLEKVLMHLNNDFKADTNLQKQSYTIQNGTLKVENILDGQYVRIYGSSLNDGFYQYPLSGLVDETFYGYVVALNIPRIVLTLIKEISEWSEKNQPTAVTSESFGGYSYSKASSKNGIPAGWEQVFKQQLDPYRKMKQH